MKKSAAVRKVERILSKNVCGPVGIGKITGGYVNYENACLFLPRGKWAMIPVFNLKNTDHVYGDSTGTYSKKIGSVVFTLVSAGLITYKEADEFIGWVNKETVERTRKTDIESMQSLAKQYGYTVTRNADE
jgi:hypothetical protein